MLSQFRQQTSGRFRLCLPTRLSKPAFVRAAASGPATTQQHVTIVGGGAAGLTAAFFAAREGAKVTVLERTSKCGTKILMSGGTRCNVLPVEVDLQRDFFTGGSTSAMRAVFASWGLEECKAWLEDAEEGLGLPLQMEQETLKYFPASNSAKEVRDRLVDACTALGVTFRYNSGVEGIRSAGPPAGSSGGGSSPAAGTPAEGQEQQQQQQQRPARSAGTALPSDRGREGASSSGRGEPAAAGPPRKAPWLCTLADGSSLECDRLVVSTGGLSFPGVGTDGTGHRIVRRLGHDVRETFPALTPLTGPHPAGASLAGLSLYNVELRVATGGKKTARAARSDMLFTHKGFSGPAVLDLSHHAIRALQAQQQQQQQQGKAGAAGVATAAAVGAPARPAKPAAASAAGTAAAAAAAAPPSPRLSVSWTGEPAAVWDERLRAGGPPLVATVLRRHGVRERLADALCGELGLEQRRLAQLQGAERARLVAALTSYPLTITGSEGYKKAEVTGGGVPLEQVSCTTLESRALPGIHLAGEILDVFGRIGGYNFYWAWVSGRLAGLGAACGGDDAAVARALRDQKHMWGLQDW